MNKRYKFTMDGVVKYRNVSPEKEEAFFEKYGQYNPTLVVENEAKKNYMSHPLADDGISEEELTTIQDWVGELKNNNQSEKSPGINQSKQGVIQPQENQQEQQEVNTELDLVLATSNLLSTNVDSTYSDIKLDSIINTTDIDTIKKNNAKNIELNLFEKYRKKEQDLLKKDSLRFDEFNTAESQKRFIDPDMEDFNLSSDLKEIFYENNKELANLYSDDASLIDPNNVDLTNYQFKSEKEFDQFLMNRAIHNKNILKGKPINEGYEPVEKPVYFPIYDLNKDGIVTEVEMEEYNRRQEFNKKRNAKNEEYLNTDLESTKIEAVGDYYDEVVAKWNKENKNNIDLATSILIEESYIVTNGETGEETIVSKKDWEGQLKPQRFGFKRSMESFYKQKDISEGGYLDYERGDKVDSMNKPTKIVKYGGSWYKADSPEGKELIFIKNQVAKSNANMSVGTWKENLNPAQINYKQNKIDEVTKINPIFFEEVSEEDYNDPARILSIEEWAEANARFYNKASKHFEEQATPLIREYQNKLRNNKEFITRTNKIVEESRPNVIKELNKQFGDILFDEKGRPTTAEIQTMFRTEGEKIHTYYSSLSTTLPKGPNGFPTKRSLNNLMQSYNNEINALYEGLHCDLHLAYNNSMNEILFADPQVIEMQDKNHIELQEKINELEKEISKEKLLGYTAWKISDLEAIGKALDEAGFGRKDVKNMEPRFRMLEHFLKGALKDYERANPDAFINNPKLKGEFIDEYYDYFYDKLLEQIDVHNNQIKKSDFYIKLYNENIRQEGLYGPNRIWKDKFGNTQVKGLTVYYPKDANKYNDPSRNTWAGGMQPYVIYETNIIDYLYSNDKYWVKERNKYPNNPEKQYQYAADKYGVTNMTRAWAEQTIEEGGRVYMPGTSGRYNDGEWHEVEGGFDASSNLDIAVKLFGERWRFGLGGTSFMGQWKTVNNAANYIIKAPTSKEELGSHPLLRAITDGPGYEMVPIFNMIPEMRHNLLIKTISEKDPKELTELEEQILITNSMKNDVRNQVDGLSELYSAGRMIRKSIPFIIEFLGTSPLGSALKTSTTQGIKKAITYKLTDLAVDKSGKLVLSNGMKLSTGYKIADKAIDVIAFTTAVNARATVGGMGHTINGTINRMTDEMIWSLSTDADGLIDGLDIITASDPEGIKKGLKPGEAFEEAFSRSHGMTFGEYMTESIGWMIPGAGRNILNIPGIIRKGGGRYGDMIFDSDTYKRITVAHFMRKMGMSTAAEVSEWAAKHGGYHGMLGELGEEYINIPWQNLMEGHGTPLLAGFLKYDMDGNPIDIDWEAQRELLISVGFMSGVFAGGGVVASKITGSKKKYYDVSVNKKATLRYNSKKALDRYLKRLESQGFFENQNNKIHIRTYNDFKAADEYRTFLETYRLAESSTQEAEALGSGALTEDQKSELITINNRLDELNSKRYLTESEQSEKTDLESRKIELNGGIEIRHTIEADGTTKLTSGKRITASELDILSVDEKDGGLDEEGRQRLLAINDELGEIYGKSGKLTEKELKRKLDLETEKNKLIGNIEKKIIERKTKRAYFEQVEKVKKIIVDKGLGNKIQITEALTDKETRDRILELFGLTEKNGKFFDINGNDVTNLGVKKDKDGKITDEGQSIEDIFKELQTTHGYFIPADLLGKGEKSHIIINQTASFKNRGENVASHEFFHWYLNQALSNTPELRIALGESFKNYLMSIDPKGIRNSEFRKRLETYINEDAATQSEEAMALFLDAMASGELAYKESIFQKIGTIIKHLFRSVGVDIVLNDGKDVYDFIVDFNDSMQRGDLSASLMKTLEGKIKIGSDMVALSNRINKFQKEQQEAFDKKFKEDLSLKFSEIGIEIEEKTIDIILEAHKGNQGISSIKKSKIEKKSPAEINEEVYQEVLENAKKNNIPNDKLKDAVTQRMRDKLFEANMAAANRYAAEAYAKGKAALKGTDFVAAALEDLQQEFYVELVLLTQRWNPSVNPAFGAYVQMPKGLPIKYGQVLNRALQKTGLVTQSQAALEEAGYQFTDDSVSSTSDVLQQEQQGGIMVRDQILNLPDNVIANIESAIKKANIKLKKKDGSAISYKEIKQEVIKGKLNSVLADVGNAFGIPTQKLVKKSDLNNEQRTNARNKIVELAKNNNLIDLLPEAQDQNATSTEIVRTKFGQFYEKIADRASTAGKQIVGGQKIFAKKTGGQKALYAKMDQVPNQDILDIFGINQDGSFQSGTRYDGAIREFAVQLATAAANQELRLDATRKGVDKKTIEDVASGKSRILFAKGSKAEQVGGEFNNTNETIKEINPEFQDDATRKFMNMLLTTLGYKQMYDFSTKENIDEFFDFVAPLWISVLPPNIMGYQYFYHSRRVLSKGGDIVIEVEGKQMKTKDYYKQRLGEFYIKKDKAGKESEKGQWFIRNKAERKAKKLPPLKIGKPFTGPGAKFKHQTFGSAIGNTAAKMKKSDEDGTIKRFNEINLSAHQQFWARINESIKNSTFENRENTIRGWGNFLRMVGMDVTHIHRMGEVIGYSPNPKGGRMKPSKKHPEGKFKLYEWEHAMQATLSYLYIYESIIEPGYDFDTAYDLAMQNYKIIALDYFYNQFLERAGRAKSMGKNWNIFMSFLDRYFDAEVVESNQGFGEEDGISTSSIIRTGTNGKTFKQHYGINNDGSLDIINKSKSQIKTRDNLSDAISKRILSSKTGKKRGMSTFDFDDTLGFTKSGVRVTLPNPEGTPKPKRKVIFLAGGAGSGKGNVINKLGLEGMGFKIVNSDISLEWLKKNHGLPEDMRELTKEQRSTLGKLGHQARKIAKGKMMKYQGEGNGVIVDGTGGSSKQMQKLVDEFQAKGYDVSMLFVNTSLDVALARNRARKERSLLDVIVKRNHEAVQNNKSTFKDMFGKRFMEVNTDKLTQESPMPKTLINKMNDFVSSYEKRRIDATEFAEQGAEILGQGGKFDFSEFNDVVDGTPGPLLDKAKERAKKYGTKDMFVLTARPQASDKAIHEFLKSQGLNIPLKNITGLANSTGEAKAKWMLEKFAEGYNDLYFVDDALANVEAVREVLDQLDVKSKVVQAKVKFSKTASKDFNEMLERKKGISAERIISRPEAKKLGKGKGRWDYYIPPSAEDFKGLLYYFLGKGKQGEADLKFLADNLLKPFAKGIRNWNAYKQSMVNDFKNLKKRFPKVKLNKKIKGTEFTNDTAIRVYLWVKSGFEIEGLSTQRQKELVDYVNSNSDIKKFADTLSLITKRKDGYVPPSENWMLETIPTDLRNIVDKIGRKEFLQEWIENKNIIFSPQNINKIEAVYGAWFREALEDILYRMENGGNRRSGKGRVVNFFTEWINDSIGAIMFFNMRSAILQTISTVNFINWHDNNIFKAAGAFANQPQFWQDFVMLFNSDQLKQRRGGLQTDVSASELTKSFAENGYTPRTLLRALLQFGFTPTQIADSFAIAFGGATLYRNRYNTYIKKGMTPEQANEQAMLDFQEIAEETQQSSREDLVSQQQSTLLGRFVLAFQNVTMQYGRLTKKALADLVNGRGDPKTNISKILYYGFVQNVVFSALQSALAFLMWGDDEEEIESKTRRVFNNTLDSFLRGMGLYGAMVSTLKNTIIQWQQQMDAGYGKMRLEKLAIEMVNLSPPIGSKVRKIINAFYAEYYDKGTSEELGLRIENPQLQKWAYIIEGATNIPLARLVNKANNLEEAITGNHETWKRVMMALGWSRWELGVEDEELEVAKDKAKVKRTEQKKIENEKKKEQKKKEKEEEKKKEEQRLKDEGYKSIRCSGTNSKGKRCGIMSNPTKEKTWKCYHHVNFVEGMDRDNDGKPEYRCIGTKKNGKRCKNKTENKNKRCYAHQ